MKDSNKKEIKLHVLTDKFDDSYAYGKSKGLYHNYADLGELLSNHIDILNALAMANKEGEQTLLQRLEAITSKNFITQTVGEIVAEAVENRLQFLETQVNKTVTNKAKILSNLDANAKKKANTVGSAYLRLDAHIKNMMAYNENAEQKDRIYVSLSTSRKDNGNGLGKVRVNADAAKDYFTKNERKVINHNVEMGIFEQSIKYLKKSQKEHALRIARDCGYEG